jgi:dihydroorotate dehydrogenase
MYQLFKPLIFCLEPETAHNLAIKFLKFCPRLATILAYPIDYSNLNNKVFDLDFSSPIGLSAGFDKNCEVAKTLIKFGFGFIEVGTTTPLAQIGNEQPRIFRLNQDQAIINRLGFNNLGADVFFENLQSLNQSLGNNSKKIIGVNIGKNKDTINAIDDYKLLIEKFYNHANYITINISSPNTKNLRDLQNEQTLYDFLQAIDNTKQKLKAISKINTPILLKIAPDLDFDQQQSIAKIALQSKISGLIISNTSVARDFNLKSKNADQVGGLSGKPIFEISNQVLKNIYHFTEGKLPIIGVGGISSAQDVYRKIKLGASLVQIYTALIYQGFGMIEKLNQQLSELLIKDGYKNIKQAIGVDNN